MASRSTPQLSELNLFCVERLSLRHDVAHTFGAYVHCLARQARRHGRNLQRSTAQTKVLQATRDQIEKDLRRTFPAGAPHNTATIDALRRVLVTYATYNPSVGYCQGMNFLAAVLLLHLPEEGAFWGLHALADRILHGYFWESMRGALTDQLVCGRLLQRHFPTLAQHARALHMDLAQPVLQWYAAAAVARGLDSWTNVPLAGCGAACASAGLLPQICGALVARQPCCR